MSSLSRLFITKPYNFEMFSFFALQKDNIHFVMLCRFKLGYITANQR